MGIVDIDDQPVALAWPIDYVDFLPRLKWKGFEKIYGFS